MNPSHQTFAAKVPREEALTAHFTLDSKEATKILTCDITVLQRKLPCGRYTYFIYEINKTANARKNTLKELHYG